MIRSLRLSVRKSPANRHVGDVGSKKGWCARDREPQAPRTKRRGNVVRLRRRGGARRTMIPPTRDAPPAVTASDSFSACPSEGNRLTCIGDGGRAATSIQNPTPKSTRVIPATLLRRPSGYL